MIEKAREFSLKNYHNKTREFSNQSYFDHAERVACSLKYFTTDEDIIAAAYLHDILEKTSLSVEDIQNIFGKRIAHLVWELTLCFEEAQILGKIPYFINRINLMSNEAFLIQLADSFDKLKDLALASKEIKELYFKEAQEVIQGFKRILNPEQEKLLHQINQFLQKHA